MTVKAKTSKTTKTSSKTLRQTRTKRNTKGTKPSTVSKKTPTKKPTTKKPVAKKPVVKKTTPQPAATTKASSKAPRVYSAVVGFRSKVWGLVYTQRSNGGKMEVCMKDGMTKPEAVKAAKLLDAQETIQEVRVAAFPTKKQMSEK